MTGGEEDEDSWDKVERSSNHCETDVNEWLIRSTIQKSPLCSQHAAKKTQTRFIARLQQMRWRLWSKLQPNQRPDALPRPQYGRRDKMAAVGTVLAPVATYPLLGEDKKQGRIRGRSQHLYGGVVLCDVTRGCFPEWKHKRSRKKVQQAEEATSSSFQRYWQLREILKSLVSTFDIN